MLLVFTIIILIIIIVIIIINCIFYRKISKSIEIVQINDITKDNLEETVNKNKPIIIENISNNLKFTFKDNNNIKLVNFFPIKSKEKKIIGKKKDYFSQFPKNGLSINKEPLKNELPFIFNSLIKNYHSPLTINIYNYYHFITPKFKRNISKTNLSRNIYLILEGDCYFRLYHPKNIKELKFISGIDKEEFICLYQQSHNKFNELQYIDIIIRKNQGIVIPRYWGYTFYTKTKCILVNSISNDIIGNIVNLFNI